MTDNPNTRRLRRPSFALTMILDTAEAARQITDEALAMFCLQHQWIYAFNREQSVASDVVKYTVRTQEQKPDDTCFYNFLTSLVIRKPHIRHAYIVYKYPWPDSVLGRFTINSNLYLTQQQIVLPDNDMIPDPLVADDFDMLYWQHLANAPIETAPEHDIQLNHFPITFRFQFEYKDQDEVLL